MRITSDENADNSTEVNRSAVTSLKKVTNRSYPESSTVISNRSSGQPSQTTGSAVLMGTIIGSNKDITEETLFLGAEIPKYGVVTEHEMELEKVRIFSYFITNFQHKMFKYLNRLIIIYY